MEGMDSELYNFNAPQHYFNFNEGMPEEPDDSYFDCNDSIGAKKSVTPSIKVDSPHVLRSSKKVPLGTPKRTPLADVTPVNSQVPTETPKLIPISKETPQKTPDLRQGRESPFQNEEEKENAPQAQHTGKHATPKTLLQAKNGGSSKKKNKSSFGIRSSPRLAAIAKVKALRRSNAARRSLGSGSRRTSDISISNLSIVNKQKTMNKPSVPKVPGMKGLDDKDCSDLAEIATFKKKLAGNKKKTEPFSTGGRVHPTVPQEFHFATDARLRQKNQENHDVPCNSASAPVKATRLGPTKPREFHFATDNRIKKQVSADAEEPLSFPKYLRAASNAAQERDAPKGPTIPQPFKLSESRKLAGSTELSKFVSVAELNMKFYSQTPPRFRSKRNDESDDSSKRKKNKTGSRRTVALTPELSTRTRLRQVSYPTREELEEREYLEEQKHKFKAQPINKKIYEAPPQLAVEKKHITVPEPFNITKSKKQEAPICSNYKEICNKLGCSTSSLASLPWGGICSEYEKTNTKVQPFSFDMRDKEKLQKKQEMILKILEEEKKAAEFHAQPMPVFEDGLRGLPEKKPPTPTRVQPFNLRSNQRGEKIREQFQRTLAEEEKQDKERRTFKATSDDVVHKQPFIPEKSKKPCTDISGFILNTEVRSEARNEFDLLQKQRTDELSAAKRVLEARQEAEEAAAVAKMRREAVHKANPVPHYKPVEIKPSSCPPTVPLSPNFATKSRLRSRLNSLTTSADSTMDISTATYTAE